MRIPRLKKIRLKDPLYQSDIVVLVGGDTASLRRYLHRKHGSEVRTYNKNTPCDEEIGIGEDSGGLQFHVKRPQETFYIWVAIKDIDTMWHEVYHLTHDILFARGIIYSDSAEDAFAYFGGALFAQIYKKLFMRSQ